ncbi:signal peptidase I [Thermocrinis jamiesonii]|uniref:signal peptidase I n=1 Tax=Thermocrinis jamiesonii TaxID=1302351 RepID=UPI000495BCB5|nr:signal peptidase I [Thermocrinis jamiesonii]
MSKRGKWVTELIVVVMVVLLIRTFVAQAYNIPSGSMKPTLLVGDFILVNKLVYRFSEPQRGDIVVFKYPIDPRIDFIKRIIGIPGDVIEIRDNQVFINGEPAKLVKIEKSKEDHFTKIISEETLPGGVRYRVQFYEEAVFSKRDFGPIKVPPGHYFVMGDNRDNSEDSRYWGFLPRENIVGKAFVIYFSGDVPPLQSTEVSFITGIKQLLIALINPRFERIGKPLIW